MKIKERNDMVLFKSLNVGDVLLSPVSGSYCMKIAPIDEWTDPDSAETRNAVNLVDGTLCFVEEEAQVEYVECELRIK